VSKAHAAFCVSSYRTVKVAKGAASFCLRMTTAPMQSEKGTLSLQKEFIAREHVQISLLIFGLLYLFLRTLTNFDLVRNKHVKKLQTGSFAVGPKKPKNSVNLLFDV
jgi:hypothetical protein